MNAIARAVSAHHADDTGLRLSVHLEGPDLCESGPPHVDSVVMRCSRHGGPRQIRLPHLRTASAARVVGTVERANNTQLRNGQLNGPMRRQHTPGPTLCLRVWAPCRAADQRRCRLCQLYCDFQPADNYRFPWPRNLPSVRPRRRPWPPGRPPTACDRSPSPDRPSAELPPARPPPTSRWAAG